LNTKKLERPHNTKVVYVGLALEVDYGHVGIRSFKFSQETKNILEGNNEDMSLSLLLRILEKEHFTTLRGNGK
jgi:hypothetical protein